MVFKWWDIQVSTMEPQPPASRNDSCQNAFPRHSEMIAHKVYVNGTFSPYNTPLIHFITVAGPYYCQGATDTTLKIPHLKFKCPATQKQLPK